MARTTSSAVQAILLDHYDGSSDLTAFIDTANALTSRVSTCATARGESLTTTELERIEAYIAAHLYALADQIEQEKKTGDAAAVFQGKTGLGLEGTQYGQMALALDITGCLRSFSSGTRGSVAWLGKAPSDQTDYQDRD